MSPRKLAARRWPSKALALALASTCAIAGLAGCGWTETHEVVLRRATGPGPNHQVELFMVGQPVPHPIYEIAFLQVVGRGTDANLEDLVKGLAQRARALGCDAVANIQVQQGYSVAHAFGVCVQYASSGIAPPPAPLPGAIQAPPAPPPPGAAPPPSGSPQSPPSPQTPPEQPGAPRGTSI